MSPVASTLAIGPIITTPYDFHVQRSSPSNVKGFRIVTFTGQIENALADQLDAMVVNPATRVSIGGGVGVLAYVAASSTALPNLTGYYLLETFDSSPDGIDPDWPYSTFSLKATFVGDVPS